MAEDENIPFSFQADGWVENPPQCANLSQDEVWRYLRSKSDSVRHGNRGWAFKEEGYVRLHLRKMAVKREAFPSFPTKSYTWIWIRLIDTSVVSKSKSKLSNREPGKWWIACSRTKEE